MKYPFISGFALGVLVATASIYAMDMSSETPEPLSDRHSFNTSHMIKSPSQIAGALSGRHDPSTSGNCSFGIAKSDGVIQAVDWNVLQPIGFFEKYNDGTVVLITPSGYARDVTKCFRNGDLKKYLPEITIAKN